MEEPKTESIMDPSIGKPKKEEKIPSSIDEARATVKDMKEQLDRREALVAREEAMAAEKMLSGSADAGQEPPKKKEPTDKEYADKVMAGDLNG